MSILATNELRQQHTMEQRWADVESGKNISGSLERLRAARAAKSDTSDYVQDWKVHYTAAKSDKERADVFVNLIVMTSVRNNSLDDLRARLTRGERREIDRGVAKMTQQPWTAWELFRRDVILFFGGPGRVVTIIFGAIWLGLMFTPKSLMRGVCVMLGWPSPDEFEGSISRQNAELFGFLGDILKEDFGIHEDQIIHIRGRR